MKVRIRKYPWQPTMPDWVYEIEILRNAWWSFFEFLNDWQERRRVSVKIDPWDTWSMDHTLAEIVLPMLVQLKQTKHGAPNVDAEDVPENLRAGKLELELYAKNGTTDALFFKRWDWVLDEMIFAFNSKLEDWEDQFHSGEHDILWEPVEHNGEKMYEMKRGPKDTHEWDSEGHQAYQDRINNGFRLFGKYYNALWD